MTESLASTGGALSGDRRASAIFSRRRLIYAAPLVGFSGLAVLFASGLGRDPSLIPSALIGQPVPKFSLPPVMGRTLGLSSEDLVGEVSLVNVFASWCVACREEHPLLMRLSTDKQIKIHGLNYKDQPENASRWLNANGDPYIRTGADRDGRVAIDWGVYGVPETFVISADARIAFKQIGPLTEEALDRTILPLVARLRGKAGA
jgi:cytochrome c biogenesis protein CcmG/thiol:disulfide interchange protein DsbE